MRYLIFIISILFLFSCEVEPDIIGVIIEVGECTEDYCPAKIEINETGDHIYGLVEKGAIPGAEVIFYYQGRYTKYFMIRN